MFITRMQHGQLVKALGLNSVGLWFVLLFIPLAGGIIVDLS